MSLFGTFRRTKKKHSVDVGVSVGGNLPSSSAVFTSTPNLLKLEQQPKNLVRNGHLPPLPPTIKRIVDNTCTPDDGQEKKGFERSVSAVQTPAPKLVKKGSTSSMRSFMSMMNVMGSLKRGKSTRKLGWGSSMTVSSPDKEFSQSPGASGKRHSASSAKSQKCKSEEFLDTDAFEDDVDSVGKRKKGRRKVLNTEPGVLSSESSSENSSLHSEERSSSLRAGSERSDFLEESASEDEAMEKDPAEVERKTNILLGTKKFNMDPKKGIEFLVEKGIFEDTPEGVARFLKEGYGLSKASIGNYMGERSDFNEKVLTAFVQLHDFKNLILVQALRQFLWGFRLPGESQKISRMLDAFADRYCENNPELFSSLTCSVLCYSIIMLNTELHNPNVKDKVTLDQFIKRNRGIEGGEAISVQFMSTLYNSILTEPFRFPEEDGNDLMLTFFNPDYEGWLYKFGGRPRSWKRLWFILSNNCLYYFKFTTDKTPLGIIPLENILVRIPQERSNSKLFVLTLYKESVQHGIVENIKTCKTLSNGATVPRLYPSIQLGTQDPKMRERWVRAINANHSMHRFYSDLTLKKMRQQKSQENKKSSVGVRKSQISLPSTTSSKDIPLPAEVLQVLHDKDPNNFFAGKNFSCVNLLAPPPPEAEDAEGMRARSRSESRLFEGRKSSLAVPSTLTTPRSRSNSKSPVLRHKNRHNHLQDPINKSPLLIPPPPSPSQVQVRKDPANPPTIYEKYKKLSMIQELTMGGGFRSDSISSVEEDVAINTVLSRISSSSSTSSASQESFEYKMLEKGDLKESLEQLLSDEEDAQQLREDKDIQIIDFCNPNIHTKSVPSLTLPLSGDCNGNSDKCENSMPPQIMCFESIYESNV